jgi:TonB-dependent receptor
MLRTVACLLALAPLTTLVALQPPAQQDDPAEGDLAGRITDSAGIPVPGAVIHIAGTHYGQAVGADGLYRLFRIPAGAQTVVVRCIGFARDSFVVTIVADSVTTALIRLRPVAVGLGAVTVQAHRPQTSAAAATVEQQDAPNLVNVAAGDVIRALPNANAADAAGRVAGVTTERVEGEGEFVEIRGTEPGLSNVTIDGMPVPGTEQGARNVKLDEVPEDLLANIAVTKTITPDVSADAIGGSVDLVTKTPDGPPHGYLSGQFGHMSLLNRVQGEGGFTYGGRVGPKEQFGFLIGASIDQNDRVINDLEPTWTPGVGAVSAVPNEFSLQDSPMTRTRWGVGGDLDYRFGDHSLIFVRGLYSHFDDHGVSYQYDVGYGGGVDSASVGTGGYETNATLNRVSQTLTPTEQLFGVTAGGEQALGAGILRYAASASGTQQVISHFRTSMFTFDQPVTYRFTFANPNSPTYGIVPPTMAQVANDASQYNLAGYDDDDEKSVNRDVAGHVDYRLCGWQMGASYRQEVRTYTNTSYSATYAGAPLSLAQFVSTFTDPGFYSAIRPLVLGPVPNDAAVRAYESANRSQFQIQNDPVGDATGSFSGTENVGAAYLRRDWRFGRLALLAGVRVEHTEGTYSGHVQATDSTVAPQTGKQSYTDVFPNAQLRYAVDGETNLRLALTRAIARPSFADLAPSVNGLVGDPATIVMIGNPALKPERALNLDLEAEHFLPMAGVISAGVFYKRISDFIYTHAIPGYDTPPYNDGETYRAGQPQNGSDAWLVGLETEWTQHLIFLPGALAGLGFSATYTRLHSVALVPGDSGGQWRKTSLPRQSPDLAELAALYDYRRFSARVEWSYQGANITSYGDGTSNAATGDQYFYAHSQIDAAFQVTLRRGLELSLEGENLNNAVFGFFVGTPKMHYSFQREYYGPAFLIGLKQDF